MIKKIETALKTSILLLIKSYQLTRGMRSHCCRFYPSCSDYCVQAIEKHGLLKGIAFGVARLMKCHPWHEGGVDLVSNTHIMPDKKSENISSDLLGSVEVSR